MTAEHPALVASRNSWRCVQAKDKAGWLDLMAEDVCIEDPIGVAMTNPTGKGVQGKAAVSEFYDKNIAPATIRVEAHESYPSEANEAAHLMTLTTTLPNGVVSRVRGIFTYRVNDEGKITNLRGYWTMGSMEFEQPSE
jgi:steroid delta-isomerase